MDKHNVIKNQKYFGITTPPPRSHYGNELVGSLLNAKKNFVTSAVSSLIQGKLSKLSGSFGFGSGGHHSGSSLGASAGASLSPSLGASAGASLGSSLGASAGASLGSHASSGLSYGASVNLPTYTGPARIISVTPIY